MDQTLTNWLSNQIIIYESVIEPDGMGVKAESVAEPDQDKLVHMNWLSNPNQRTKKNMNCQISR